LDLSIIFVNWNSLEYLRDCIASVLTNTKKTSFEIIVVDNASPQGGVELLKEQFPQVTVLKSEENLGFAGANNLGFRHASGEYVLLLNPDTLLVGPTIDLLMDAVRNLPDAGIVGCKMLNTDLSIQTTSIQKFPTILNQLFNSEYLHLKWPGCPLWNIAPLFSDQGGIVSVEVIPGACMLLRSKVFAEVGMFSEDYFMYAEDLDLNFKLRKAGYANYYVGQATIIHHGGRSSSRQKVSQWSTMMKFRAMTRYYRKNRGRTYELGYRAAMSCVALGRLLILGLMVPFGNAIRDKQYVRNAFEKWKVVLRCAIGRQDLALKNHR
jgi:N-acetylglucosaminyl-diphospho-decaprenol L-rhamnosyltransferase